MRRTDLQNGFECTNGSTLSVEAVGKDAADRHKRMATHYLESSTVADQVCLVEVY